LFISYSTFKGAKGNPPGGKLKPGQNPVLFAPAPANDTYDYNASVVPPPGTNGATTFTGSITLARTC
jgi:hypothetical protein